MLQADQNILLPASGPAKVVFVNESRARVRLLSVNNCEDPTRRVGSEFDISPESEVEIIEVERLTNGWHKIDGRSFFELEQN
jgi:hypothetical protein